MAIEHQFESSLPFDRMNETDVRAEVLEPLLRRLGYSMVGEALIRREHPLSYPNLYLGRKKNGRDLVLRGTADFTLEVTGHARWTLEAKAPSQPLNDEVLQQAWSYAAHPEVQSTYFCICNGRVFEIYATSSAWADGPVLRLPYDELESRFAEVRAFLGPSEIRRHHPNHLLSVGKPLAPGLRAFARIASGTISYHEASLPIPLLSQMQVSIVDGAICRDSSGQIQVQVLTKGPFRDLQDKIDGLGLSRQIYLTDDVTLSVSRDKPTVLTFESEEPFSFGLDVSTFKATDLDQPLQVHVRATAIGHLEQDVFSGQFVNAMTFHRDGEAVPVLAKGRFELRLA